jgi:Zn-dependent protease
MDGGIKLGRIWNVPIKLHFSWFLIAGLITWSLATGYFPNAYPQISPTAHWALGAITALLFASSVLLHELGHVRVALRENIPVRGVTLFIFGGVAQITEEPRSAGAEFRIAIAGPLTSLLLAGIFGVFYLLEQTVPLLAAPSQYLMRLNFMLAIFNMIPGFPLDGGRVFRALVWRITGSPYRATRIASTVGQLVAFGFIGVGIFTAVTGNVFNGLWLAFIGWFLQNAAASAFQHAAMEKSLEGITVAQVMRRDVEPVQALTPIDRLVAEQVVNRGRRSFLVNENGQLRGLITLANIVSYPQRQWPFLTARQVMVPVEQLKSVAPYEELMKVLKDMEKTQQIQVAVVEEHQVLGTLSRDDIIRYLRVRTELGI